MGLRAFVRDLASVSGVNLHQLSTLRRLPRYIRDWRTYERLRGEGDLKLEPRYAFPILVDFSAQAGTASGHYFHQDLWAARHVFTARPSKHVDVGSRIDGFVAHVLTFMPVTVVDFCPLESKVTGLTFVQGDLCKLEFPDASLGSLSCLHALEHVGLGRYGDPIDPGGWRKGLAELARVLQPGGTLLLSVPVGKPARVRFNGDRVFSAASIPEELPDLRLLEFNLVTDDGALHAPAEFRDADNQENGCGLYLFTKSPRRPT